MRFLTILLTALLFSPITAQADEITVSVAGMTCEACTQTMEKKFSKEESVESVTASFKAQEIIINEKENAALSDEKIAEIIYWGGYELKEIARN